MWNVEISYPRLNTQAGETVRHTVGGVGVRCGKREGQPVMGWIGVQDLSGSNKNRVVSIAEK